MKRLLIINKDQFGYHTDVYKWCEFLRSDYLIEVVCIGGSPRIELEGVKVHYVKPIGNRTTKGILYILTALYHILLFRGLIIVCNFSGCRIFKTLCPWKKMILDIRSLGISTEASARDTENIETKRTTDQYDFTTIISEGTRDKIRLSKEKSAIVPLGADIVSTTNKSLDTLRLLYVGTLQDRDIHKTIEGVALFLQKHPDTQLTYDIIGKGFNNEIETFAARIKALGLEQNITLHGYIRHDKLKTFFDRCNVGVSFVPVTEYYDHQPVTKTYEYILSGIYTIATNTYSNRQIISIENGVLTDDTPEAFAEAIAYIWEHRNSIDSERVRNTLTESQWETIVKKNLLPTLKTLEDRFSI